MGDKGSKTKKKYDAPVKRTRDQFTKALDILKIERTKFSGKLEKIKKEQDPSIQDSKYKELYDEYRDRIWIEFDDVAAGPGSGDKDVVLNWFVEHHEVIALLLDENFIRKFYGRDIEDNHRALLDNLREIGDSWFAKYITDALLKSTIAYDGTEHDPSNDKIGNITLDVHTSEDLETNYSMVLQCVEKLKAQTNLPSIKKLFGEDFSEDMKRFAIFADGLTEAKTSHDSAQYENIINPLRVLSKVDDIKALGTEAETRDFKKLNQRQRQAFKMYLIKDRIDKYLSHKASGGIKPNVYHKLAEVEELNIFVCKRIKELNVGKFKVGKRNFDPDDIKATVQEEFEALSEKNNTDIPYASNDGKVSKSVEQAEKKGIFVDHRELLAVADCMDRIALKAAENKSSKAKDIIAAKNIFLSDPAQSSVKNPDEMKYDPERTVFTDFAARLEKAKTRGDSDAYCDIIKYLEQCGKNAGVPDENDPAVRKELAGLDSEQLQAFKWFRLREKIDAYLVHKAKDGVKTNTYRKLSLIDELDELADNKIKGLAPKDFKIGKKQYGINPDHMNTPRLSIDYYTLRRTNSDVQNPQWPEYKYDEWKKVAKGSLLNPDETELKRVAASMDRIIMRAYIVKPGAVDDLAEAKENMFRKPLPTAIWEEAPKKKQTDQKVDPKVFSI